MEFDLDKLFWVIQLIISTLAVLIRKDTSDPLWMARLVTYLYFVYGTYDILLFIVLNYFNYVLGMVLILIAGKLPNIDVNNRVYLHVAGYVLVSMAFPAPSKQSPIKVKAWMEQHFGKFLNNKKDFEKAFKRGTKLEPLHWLKLVMLTLVLTLLGVKVMRKSEGSLLESSGIPIL